MYIGVVLSRRRPNDGDIVGEGVRTACETRETSCARRKESKNAAVRTAYADEIKYYIIRYIVFDKICCGPGGCYRDEYSVTGYRNVA